MTHDYVAEYERVHAPEEATKQLDVILSALLKHASQIKLTMQPGVLSLQQELWLYEENV